MSLKLDEAACLLAFDDPDRAGDEKWTDRDASKRNRARNRLRRLLEGGEIVGQGRVGYDTQSPEEYVYGWTEHSNEISAIPSSAWEHSLSHCISWNESVLTTDTAQWINVRIDEAYLSFISTPARSIQKASKITGPKKGLRHRVAMALLKLLQNGQVTQEELLLKKDEAEASAYGVSRGTYVNARNLAISEFVRISKPKS
jgi:hypothetical protein